MSNIILPEDKEWLQSDQLDTVFLSKVQDMDNGCSGWREGQEETVGSNRY